MPLLDRRRFLASTALGGGALASGALAGGTLLGQAAPARAEADPRLEVLPGRLISESDRVGGGGVEALAIRDDDVDAIVKILDDVTSASTMQQIKAVVGPQITSLGSFYDRVRIKSALGRAI